MILELLILTWLIHKATAWLTDRIMEQNRKKREILWPDYESSELQMLCFRDDLAKKAREMEEDQKTTEADWLEILPLCQYANRWYAEVYPERNLNNARRLENFIKSKLDP